MAVDRKRLPGRAFDDHVVYLPSPWATPCRAVRPSPGSGSGPRVGQTGPTDFARDFDPELAGELMPKWIAIGRIPANSMDVVEVGRFIADSLALAWENPTVELQDMILRAPGGTFTGDVSSMKDDIDDAHEAVYGTQA